MKKNVLLIFTVSVFFSCTNVSEEDLIDDIVPPAIVTYNADIKVKNQILLTKTLLKYFVLMIEETHRLPFLPEIP